MRVSLQLGTPTRLNCILDSTSTIDDASIIVLNCDHQNHAAESPSVQLMASDQWQLSASFDFIRTKKAWESWVRTQVNCEEWIVCAVYLLSKWPTGLRHSCTLESSIHHDCIRYSSLPSWKVCRRSQHGTQESSQLLVHTLSQ